MQQEETYCDGPPSLQRASSCRSIMCNSLWRDDPNNQLVHTKKRRRHSWHGNSISSLSGGKYSDDEGFSATEDSSSAFRKVRVAIVGGTMVGVGLVMIPLPTPGGWVVATAGMMHLGQEFPAAQRILNTTKDRVLGAFQRKPTPDTPDNDEKDPPPGEPANSPTSVQVIWDYGREEDTMIFAAPIGFAEDDVFVKVWHA